MLQYIMQIHKML